MFVFFKFFSVLARKTLNLCVFLFSNDKQSLFTSDDMTDTFRFR